MHITEPLGSHLAKAEQRGADENDRIDDWPDTSHRSNEIKLSCGERERAGVRVE